MFCATEAHKIADAKVSAKEIDAGDCLDFVLRQIALAEARGGHFTTQEIRLPQSRLKTLVDIALIQSSRDTSGAFAMLAAARNVLASVKQNYTSLEQLLTWTAERLMQFTRLQQFSFPAPSFIRGTVNGTSALLTDVQPVALLRIENPHAVYGAVDWEKVRR